MRLGDVMRPVMRAWQPVPDGQPVPRPGWAREAACAGAPVTLFFGADESSDDDTAERLVSASVWCEVCPVIGDCLATALVEERGREPRDRHGIRGGHTPTARHRIQINLDLAVAGRPARWTGLLPPYLPATPATRPAARKPKGYCYECGRENRYAHPGLIVCVDCHGEYSRSRKLAWYHAHSSPARRNKVGADREPLPTPSGIVACLDCGVEMEFRMRPKLRCAGCIPAHTRREANRYYHRHKHRHGYQGVYDTAKKQESDDTRP